MSPDVSPQARSQLISKTPLPLIRNVVIFGESGVGKSSIVNMLAGEEVFEVKMNANGTTFEAQGCAIQFGDLKINVWDTTGLNERLVKPEKAFQQLFDQLRPFGGINLLVFVMRFRVTADTYKCYHLMRDVLRGDAVPMVVAITGCDFDPDHGEWWQRNKINFSRNKMAFEAHAIGTANRRLLSYPTYEQLKKGLQDIIHKYGSLTPVPSELKGSDAGEAPIQIHAAERCFGRLLNIFRKCQWFVS